MEYKHLKVEKEGHLVTCRMSNPPLQTLNSRMLGELHHLVGTIEKDDSVRVFVCTGENGVFLRWMELTEMQALAEGQEHILDAPGTKAQALLEIIQQVPPKMSPIHLLSLRIQKLNCVTIAVMNGVVGGGGCEFSLSFDFRLVEDIKEGSFALPQTSFGLVPGGGGAWHCIRLLGRAKALDVLLHGEFMPNQTALDLGLISRLYPTETFEEDVKAFVDNFLARAPLAMRGVKELVRYGTDSEMMDFYVKELEELAKVIYSEDVKHALGMWLSNPDINAYKPQFKGV